MNVKILGTKVKHSENHNKMDENAKCIEIDRRFGCMNERNLQWMNTGLEA
jgi:hypothetical protein